MHGECLPLQYALEDKKQERESRETVQNTRQVDKSCAWHIAKRRSGMA